jgi:hypothetical protein
MVDTYAKAGPYCDCGSPQRNSCSPEEEHLTVRRSWQEVSACHQKEKRSMNHLALSPASTATAWGCYGSSGDPAQATADYKNPLKCVLRVKI